MQFISNHETCIVCGFRRFVVFIEEGLIIDAVCPMCGYRIRSEFPDEDLVQKLKPIVDTLSEEEMDNIYEEFMKTDKTYAERFLGTDKEKKDV